MNERADGGSGMRRAGPCPFCRSPLPLAGDGMMVIVEFKGWAECRAGVPGARSRSPLAASRSPGYA